MLRNSDTGSACLAWETILMLQALHLAWNLRCYMIDINWNVDLAVKYRMSLGIYARDFCMGADWMPTGDILPTSHTGKRILKGMWYKQSKYVNRGRVNILLEMYWITRFFLTKIEICKAELLIGGVRKEFIIGLIFVFIWYAPNLLTTKIINIWRR
jgi:hypothetical protein